MTDDGRFVILGTAGHIDHGKTALVRLLTGVDTDRLKEEQERGISIDLGFAHLSLPSGISCGLVDVPGHERFVKNMLAGAGGIDAVLVAIAADEGVMPQTREHLDIVRLLGVDQGVVALTKTDMVEADWLELVTESVGEYMDSIGLGGFPLVPVSSKTGAGKEDVLAALDTALERVETKSARGPVRLPVDRSFSVTGFGTVVTGTLWEGTIRPGDKLVVEPGAHEVRVRNVQVHGQDAGAARAGQRTAVALHGVERTEIPRGSWLVAPGVFAVGSMLDARVRVLKDANKPLRRRQRIRFHLGATEVMARVVPLEKETLAPGEEGLAQIRLEQPALAHPRDRFVVRTYSPSHTLAGGTVIVAGSRKRRLGDTAALDELRREESGTPRDKMLARLGAHSAGAPLADLAAAGGLSPEEAAGELEAAAEAESPEPGWWILAEDWRALGEMLTRACREYQDKNPLRWGIPKGDLKSVLPPELSPVLYQRLLDEALAGGELSQRGDLFRHGEEHVVPAPALATIDILRKALEEGGRTPPLVKELRTAAGTNPEPFLDYLVFEGEAVRVSPDLYLAAGAMAGVARWLQDHFHAHNLLSVGDLREGLGMSRKYSVPVLEYFDGLGWTRRSGDGRIAGRRLGEGI